METHGLQITVHFLVSPNTSHWVNFTQTLTPKYHVNWRFLILRTKRGKKWRPKARRDSVLGVAVTQKSNSTHTHFCLFVASWWCNCEILSQKSGLCGPINVNTQALEGTESFVSSFITGASGYCHLRSLRLSSHTLCFLHLCFHNSRTKLPFFKGSDNWIEPNYP